MSRGKRKEDLGSAVGDECVCDVTGKWRVLMLTLISTATAVAVAFLVPKKPIPTPHTRRPRVRLAHPRLRHLVRAKTADGVFAEGEVSGEVEDGEERGEGGEFV